MEGCALVVEHDVIRAGDAHDVVDAGGAEHREQGVHVVLVGFGVVGVADVAAHGEAEELAAEVVFQARAEDLLAVVEVLRADEADDGVDQHRGVTAGDGIGAGFEGLLVDAAMGVRGETGALAGFEVEDVRAVSAIQGAGLGLCFVE